MPNKDKGNIEPNLFGGGGGGGGHSLAITPTKHRVYFRYCMQEVGRGDS